LGSRGSSIKLLESIAAGRVVVSTRDGARGFLMERFPSLIVVEKIEDFQSPLERLLGDPDYRASLEPAPRLFLEKHTWHEAARALADVYSHYVNEQSSRS
jgi:glycosyltransferase involved in cell wall biosynthesis